MNLPWKTVWITGASTGIGAEVAKQLADAGVSVAISARNAATLSDLAASNPNLKSYPLDVTDDAHVASVFAGIERDLGPVDLVIAGAGTYKPVLAADMTPEIFKSTMTVNFLGVTNVLCAVVPIMKQRKRGHISWIASVAGYSGLPKAAAYGPSKAALINLAECLQPELFNDGITVSIINPGFVKTPLTAQNDFEMPFLMEVEEAARLTIAGLAKKQFEISYPKSFVRILKTIKFLPYGLYFWLIRRYILRP